jgi:1,4-dihydroxy-2-naphthoate octaprenyltransferase
MRLATFLAFGLAFLLGLCLVYRGGWPIALLGLLSILFGVLYTGGPYPLGYNGLADAAVLVFFGPVAVAGTYYVTTLDINLTVIAAGLPPGLLATAILTVNNIRDIDTDAAGGKRSLAVRFGLTFARLEYLFCVASAILFPLAYYVVTGRKPWAMLGLLSAVPAIRLLKTVLQSRDGETLNSALADTGKLLLIYSLLFSLGWLL